MQPIKGEEKKKYRRSERDCFFARAKMWNFYNIYIIQEGEKWGKYGKSLENKRKSVRKCGKLKKN